MRAHADDVLRNQPKLVPYMLDLEMSFVNALLHVGKSRFHLLEPLIDLFEALIDPGEARPHFTGQTVDCRQHVIALDHCRPRLPRT